MELFILIFIGLVGLFAGYVALIHYGPWGSRARRRAAVKPLLGVAEDTESIERRFTRTDIDPSRRTKR